MSNDVTHAVWYLLSNALALVNFTLLLLLLIGYQRIHSALASLDHRLSLEIQRNTIIEETALIAKARADVAEQRADAYEHRRG